MTEAHILPPWGSPQSFPYSPDGMTAFASSVCRTNAALPVSKIQADIIDNRSNTLAQRHFLFGFIVPPREKENELFL